MMFDNKPVLSCSSKSPFWLSAVPVMLTRLGISSWPRSDAVLVLVRQIKHRPRLARIHNGHDVRIGGQHVQEHREFVVDKL
jgi:hypothetical protein